MKYIFAVILLVLFIPLTNNILQAQNTLTKQEKKNGWTLLFDGNSTGKWRSYNGQHFPEQGWKVENGALSVLAGGTGGDIITKKKYSNFILKLEWKLEKSGNSGVFYRALEQSGQAIYWSAPEMAVLDDKNHPYPNVRSDIRKAGSLYGLIAAQPPNAKPYGKWNSIKIVAKGSHIEHWQNGKKVVEYQLWTPKWYKMVQGSKFANHSSFGEQHRGYIGLQDEGYHACFRNIMIKELN